MELSKSVLDNLALGHSSRQIEDQQFLDILQFIATTLAAKFPNKEEENVQFSRLFNISFDAFHQTHILAPTTTISPQLQFYTSLLTCLTDSSRFDISSIELKSILDDKLDEQRLGLVIDTFKQINTATRAQLALHSVNFSQLVDFHWRLDYNVHSNTLEDMREQTYILTFVVLDKDTNQTKEIVCQADIAQLNELLGQIKSAIAKKA